VVARQPVAERRVGVDRVRVAPPHPRPFDVALVDEVGHDLLGGALGDPDVRGDVADPRARIAADAEQRLRVVREESRTSSSWPASHRTNIAPLRRAAAAEGAGAVSPDDVRLAVSEAVTNVVLHAYVDVAPGPVHVALAVEGDELVVCVRDEGPGLRPRPDSPGAGLGLPVMAQLASHIDIGDGDGNGVRIRMTFPLA
jgi:serine/threonine-protein kinase RsbW